MIVKDTLVLEDTRAVTIWTRDGKVAYSVDRRLPPLDHLAERESDRPMFSLGAWKIRLQAERNSRKLGFIS